MTRKRAEYRNETKTRLRDRAYDRLQGFRDEHLIDSDSAALSQLVELTLCGDTPAMLVTLPVHLREALQEFRLTHFIDSDAVALVRVAEMLLCGIVRRRPDAVSAVASQPGPRVSA